MSTYSILVVDDEPDNFDVIEALLTDRDYALHYASHGQEAIASLDKFDPDVILLDVMMPDMDGFEVCQRIKAMPQWQAVPIIMVTALASKEDLSRCLSAGADDFVSKPVNSVELRARVQSMLRIKKQHDRIQSLSKLQRNNIHSLENNLNELRLDLAAGFPNELNLAVKNISDNISLTQQNIARMSLLEMHNALESIDRSALKLDKLHQSFLFYLQLTLATREPKNRRICAPKISIQRIASFQARQFKPVPKLVFDLEDPEVAVTAQHLDYIATVLLDHALNVFKSEVEIHVHGRVIDNTFHFWVDNRGVKSTDRSNAKLAELIQFNAGVNVPQELEMSLKIVKKIIEIYDGLFLIANTDLDNATIYITLPLAISARSKELVLQK
jgi:two-component system, sensor histidine kinase and response regulator